MNPSLLRELVSEFGSPLYVYELRDVRAAADRLRASLPARSHLYYSLKANPHPEIVRELGRAGCRAEISSTGELAIALQAGHAADECFYTGPGKTRAEIDAALTAGVRRFSVESVTDYHRVAAAAAARGVTAECLLRVHTSRPHGTSGVRMSGVPSPFGIPVTEILAAPERFAPVPGARVSGAHLFPLSNADDETSLSTEITTSIAEAARLRDEAGLELRAVDLGGGFAAPYGKAGPLPDYRGLRATIESRLDRLLPGWRSGEPETAFESGRYLAGAAGRLLCRVSDVKESHGRTFVVVDTGIHHLGGLSGLGRMLPASVEARAVPRSPAVHSGPGEAITLVGPLCTPADVLSRNVTTLGKVLADDVLEIPNVGAYGLTASLLGFLGRPVATEVVLEDGRPKDVSRLSLVRTHSGPQAPTNKGAARHEW